MVTLPQGLHRPRRPRRSPSSSSPWPTSRSCGRRRRPWRPTSPRWSTGRRPPPRCRRPPRRCSARATCRRWTPAPWRTPPASCPGERCRWGCRVTDALVAVGLVDSRNAARRAIGDGGASLNNVKLADPEQLLAESGLPARPGRAAPAWSQVARPQAAAPAEAPQPLTCGFVFCGEARLMFSTSARQGGTDTTADVSLRSRPVRGADPIDMHLETRRSAPARVVRSAESCYSGHPPRSKPVPGLIHQQRMDSLDTVSGTAPSC